MKFNLTWRSTDNALLGQQELFPLIIDLVSRKIKEFNVYLRTLNVLAIYKPIAHIYPCFELTDSYQYKMLRIVMLLTLKRKKCIILVRPLAAPFAAQFGG